ncbi:MAG: GNAT family N-acetyltransferase [Planctomycetota bacterium]|nr:GNAT family N-acetyltransferase [Planctomycetota bacterium]
MQKQVTVYYLEMNHPSELQATCEDVPEFNLMQAKIPCPELNRFLYTAVGGEWNWVDRLPWSYQKWQACLSRPGYETWVATMSGTPAGYFELEPMEEGRAEIAYFGLLPQFIGQGIGGLLLSSAIKRAWQIADRRVCLNTCTEDHPVALAFYQKHGFRIYDQRISEVELPDERPGPWPGAR